MRSQRDNLYRIAMAKVESDYPIGKNKKIRFCNRIARPLWKAHKQREEKNKKKSD